VIAARIASWTHTPVQAALTLLGERAQTVAATLGKGPLDVRIEHDRTRLDREHWTPVLSGLVHAVRNAVDHGFEGPEERARLGKPSQPVLQLRARHVDDQFVVEITDDGRGIAWARVAEELRLRGLPAETASDLAEGLFVEGLSTTRRVTDVSGRGIGMSALREAVHARGGTVEITSVGGKGTTLTCRFPAVQLNIEEFVAKPRAQLMALRARELPAGAPLSRRMQV